MQKVRLQKVWNNQTNKFEQNSFELRESDKIISGKLNISSKQDNEWISKAIPFIAFKSRIDQETQRALLHSNGELFEADFNLAVSSFKKDDKEIKYHRVIINSAVFSDSDHNQKKANGFQPNDDFSDEIPF